MTTKEAIEHFGSVRQLAHAIDLATAAIYQWSEYPPELRQYQLEVLTRGKLKAQRK